MTRARIALQTFVLSFVLILLAFHALTVQGRDVPDLDVEHIHPLDGRINRMVAKGDYLFALEGYDGGLRVYDISNPAYPSLVTTVPTSTLRGKHLVADGDYLYVTWDALYIMDVSNPENPQLLGVSEPWGLHEFSYPVDLAVHEGIAYVSHAENYICELGSELIIIDATDPANPTWVGDPVISPASALATTEDEMLLVASASRIVAYEITNPLAPVFLYDVELDQFHHEDVTSFFVSEGLLYLGYQETGGSCTGGNEGWFVIDLANDGLVLRQYQGLRTLLTYSDGYLYAAKSIFGEDHELLVGPHYEWSPIPLDFGSIRPLRMIVKDGFILAGYQFDASVSGTYRAAAASATIDPGIGGTLAYTETPDLRTVIEIGPHAVHSTTTASVLPLPSSPWPPIRGKPAGMLAAHVMDIRGHLPLDQLTLEGFQEPVTVTLPYRPDELPGAYAFLWWDGEDWVTPDDSCGAGPPLGGGGNIQAHICDVGKYALFYDPLDLYLPVAIMR